MYDDKSEEEKLPSTQQQNRHGYYCNLMPGDGIATDKGENKSNTVYFPAKHWDKTKLSASN